MTARNLIIVGAAGTGLGWRVADPVGSYAALYEASHFLTELLAGNDLISRAVGLILVDQFNGLMIGIMIGALLSLIGAVFRGLFRGVWRLFRLGTKGASDEDPARGNH